MYFSSPSYACVIYLATLFTGVALLKGQEVTFHFAPPDGFTETVQIRRGRHVTRDDNTHEDISEMHFRQTVQKQAVGYRIDRHILSNRLTRDGQTIASPMIDAMVDVKLTYHIDVKGKATSIEGYDGILKNLRSKLPPQLVKNIGILFNDESLRRDNLEEWEYRVGQFVGRTVHIGEAWLSQENIPTPGGGRIVSHTATLFAGWKACPDGHCLQILFFYDSDPDQLHKRVTQISAAALKQSFEPTIGVPVGSLKGEGERLVNPKTLRTVSEKTTRVLEARIPGKDNTTHSSKIVEFNEYTVNPK